MKHDSGAVLSPSDLARYARDGFLVLPRFVPEAACDALRERARELIAAFEPGDHTSIFTTDEQARKTDDYFLDSGDKIRFFFEEDAFDTSSGPRRLVRDKEQSINKIGHALHDLDPVFDRFSRAPAIAELVASLGIADPRLMQSMVICKQPFIGGEVRCHQDATFLHTVPERMVGLWFALEDAHRENGCLWAIPGAHLAGEPRPRSRFVRGQDRTTRLEVADPAPWDDRARVPLEVQKGGLVLLHGLLPHMSEANRSPRSRYAYTLHVVSGESAYPETNWLQRAADLPARGF